MLPIKVRRGTGPVALLLWLETAAMSDGTAPTIARLLPGLPPRLRGRVALTFAAVILTTCFVVVVLL